jgi:hypothetical protein
MARKPVLHEVTSVGALSAEVVRKLDEGAIIAAQSKNLLRVLSLCEATAFENRGCPGPSLSFHTACALCDSSLRLQ